MFLTTIAKMAFAGSPERRFKIGLRSLMRDKIPEFRRFERNMSPTIIEAALHHAWLQQEGLPEANFPKGIVDVTTYCAEAAAAYVGLTGR